MVQSIHINIIDLYPFEAEFQIDEEDERHISFIRRVLMRNDEQQHILRSTER